MILVSTPIFGQKKPPIIDMQLHAHPVDGQGPPPVAICTPLDPMPVWDPSESYSEVFLKMLKDPPCDDPVWSPETDKELMNETFDVLDKWNIFGVLSGTADRVAKWRSLKPERLYPAIEMSVGSRAPSTDSLRSLYNRGELVVLGELTTQYAGV